MTSRDWLIFYAICIVALVAAFAFPIFVDPLTGVC